VFQTTEKPEELDIAAEVLVNQILVSLFDNNEQELLELIVEDVIKGISLEKTEYVFFELVGKQFVAVEVACL